MALSSKIMQRRAKAVAREWQQPNSLARRLFAKKYCVACESGDCVSHTAGKVDPNDLIFKITKGKNDWAETIYYVRAFFKDDPNYECGFLMLRENSGVLYISDVRVDIKKMGIGRLLYQKGIELARKKKMKAFAQGVPRTPEAGFVWKSLARDYPIEHDEFGSDFIKTSATVKLRYVTPDPEGLDDEEEDQGDLYNQSHALAQSQGLNILRDKDPSCFVLDGKRLVGCLFVTDSSTKFSFDIVVDPRYQGQGVGSRLTDMAIQEYNERAGAYDDYEYEIDVVNPTMKRILECKGFRVLEKVGESRWLMGKSE